MQLLLESILVAASIRISLLFVRSQIVLFCEGFQRFLLFEIFYGEVFHVPWRHKKESFIYLRARACSSLSLRVFTIKPRALKLLFTRLV